MQLFPKTCSQIWKFAIILEGYKDHGKPLESLKLFNPLLIPSTKLVLNPIKNSLILLRVF